MNDNKVVGLLLLKMNKTYVEGGDHESIQMTRFPSSPSNVARDADNEGATGPKESVYSSVDDLPTLARGSVEIGDLSLTTPLPLLWSIRTK